MGVKNNLWSIQELLITESIEGSIAQCKHHIPRTIYYVISWVTVLRADNSIAQY